VRGWVEEHEGNQRQGNRFPYVYEDGSFLKPNGAREHPFSLNT